MSFAGDVIERLINNGTLSRGDIAGDLSGRNFGGTPFGIDRRGLLPVLPIIPPQPTAPIVTGTTLPVPEGATLVNPNANPFLPVIVTDTETTNETITGTQTTNVPASAPIIPAPVVTPLAPLASVPLPSETAAGLAAAPVQVQSAATNSLIPLALGAVVLIVFLSRR